MRRTCLDMVYELAREDPRVVFIGSDLGPGALEEFKTNIPERYFMEGVAEANLVGVAAGLAMEGFVPFFNTIATFITRRCFEQVAIDLCLHDLPVRLIGNGGGLVYAPLGPTHLAIEDMAILRALPNMTVVAVADAEEMKRLMRCTLDWPHPIYIRLAKGGDRVVSRPEDGFAIGRAILHRPPGEVLFVTTGVMLQRALAAADLLAARGIAVGVLHAHTVKPFDAGRLCELAAQARLVVTLEEHTLKGGLGSTVLEALAEDGAASRPRVLALGVPDVFPKEYGSQESMLESFGLEAEPVASRVAQELRAEAAA